MREIKVIKAWALMSGNKIWSQLNHNGTFNLMISDFKSEALQNAKKELNGDLKHVKDAKIIRVKIVPINSKKQP